VSSRLGDGDTKYDGAEIRDMDLLPRRMTMKMTTTFAAVAMCASLYLTTGPAQASISLNGLRPNGLNPNGLHINSLVSNGLYPNGIELNGLIRNGLHLNGILINGLTSNGILINGLHVNGLQQNGTFFNALTSNGVTINGTALNDGPTPEVQRESLPFNGLSQKGLGKTHP